jgi:hypothetical protein
VYHLLHTCHVYKKVTVNFPASECLLHYFLKIFLCLQIQCFSESLKGRIGKIKEDNIKIDAREMVLKVCNNWAG